MRRRSLPLFQLSIFPPHQPLIRWAAQELKGMVLKKGNPKE
jgi:hypothetical protein